MTSTRTAPQPEPVTPLRAARTRAGLTQLQLAVKAGLHLATVAIAERGARMSPETLRKLAGALGVPSEELQP
jgi:transcriptional regulator with XRE-family HTH domain